MYEKSGSVSVAAGDVGTVSVECNPGDVGIDGRYVVFGPSNFSVYSAGIKIFTQAIGSPTDLASLYFLSIQNDDAHEAITVIAEAYCMPA